MTTTVCKANVPAECRFHGSRSASHTRLLRDKLIISREVYKVAQVMSERLESYRQLQEAESDYYSTDEGRSSLVNHINETTDGDFRNQWIEILEKADQKREFHEQMSGSVWSEAKSRTKEHVKLSFEEHPVVRYSNGHKITSLSTGKYHTGEEYHFEWDETRGAVFYEETEDIESMRGLGRADTIEKARKVSEDWYNSQWHRRSNSN